MHVAETRIDSGVAAMIAGSVPLQIVLMVICAVIGLRSSAFLQPDRWISSQRE